MCRNGISGCSQQGQSCSGGSCHVMTLTLSSGTSPDLAVVLWLLMIPCVRSSSRMSEDFCLSPSGKHRDLAMNLLASHASASGGNSYTCRALGLQPSPPNFQCQGFYLRGYILGTSNGDGLLKALFTA